VSDVRIVVHYDDRQESRRQQLLALHGLRRRLEPRAQPACSRWSKQMAMTMTPHELACELRELIDALDRRVPRVERAGEASIARDAAELRAKAVRRLRELRDLETSTDRP
jgi:hypothetical protein